MGLIFYFKDSKLFLRELIVKWPTTKKFTGFLNRRVFGPVKQSLLKELGFAIDFIGIFVECINRLIVGLV